MFIRFDAIHERDGQTDGRTSHDGIGRGPNMCNRIDLNTAVHFQFAALNAPIQAFNLNIRLANCSW